MAKRFNDTEKWKNPWYRKLPCAYKVFWDYISTNCDVAGVWRVDLETASYFCGSVINGEKAIEFFNHNKVRVVVLNSGSKWLIVDFIDFQYGKLSQSCPPHKKVFELLLSYNLTLPFDYPNGRVQDKEEDKVKEKDVLLFNASAEFDKIYALYPRRVGKKDALRHFRASVKSDADLKMIYLALDNYLAHIKQNKTEIRYVKHASAWFNNWLDYVDFKEPVSYPNFKSRFPEDNRIDRTGRGGNVQRVGQISILQQVEVWKKEALENGGFFQGTQEPAKQESAK